MKNQHIILDNGSGILKAGFSGDSQPSVKMPNVIGYPSGMSAISSMELKDVYFGEDAIKNESKLKMAYPV